MSTPIQTQEELISVAYVSAIIASAGAVPSSTVHDFGVDLEVRRIGNFDGKRIDLGSPIELQLKATIKWDIKDENLIYDELDKRKLSSC